MTLFAPANARPSPRLPVVARLKRRLARTYVAWAEVERLSRAKTRYGGEREEFGLVATIPCRTAPGFILPSERALGGAITSLAQWFVYCDPQADIRASDRLQITLPDRPTPFALEVTRADAPRGVDLELKVWCQEIGTGPGVGA